MRLCLLVAAPYQDLDLGFTEALQIRFVLLARAIVIDPSKKVNSKNGTTIEGLV